MVLDRQRASLPNLGPAGANDRHGDSRAPVLITIWLGLIAQRCVSVSRQLRSGLYKDAPSGGARTSRFPGICVIGEYETVPRIWAFYASQGVADPTIYRRFLWHQLVHGRSQYSIPEARGPDVSSPCGSPRYPLFKLTGSDPSLSPIALQTLIDVLWQYWVVFNCATRRTVKGVPLDDVRDVSRLNISPSPEEFQGSKHPASPWTAE